MKFDVPCGQGRLQVTDDGYLQQVTAWKRVAWSVPARTVGGLSSKRHGLGLHVTVETPSGHHTVTTVTNQNYERLRAILAEFQNAPSQPYTPPPMPAPQPLMSPVPESQPPMPSAPPPQSYPSFTPPPIPSVVPPAPNRPWYRRMRKRTWAIVVAVILVLAVVGAISNGNQGTGSAAQSTPTAAARGQATPGSTPTQVPTQKPTPTPSFATFGDGTFTVGKDIQPGTYRTRQGSSGCYYARLKGFGGTLGDIISNNTTDNPAIITIAASDKGFQSQNCGTWTADLSAITSNKQSFGDGEYIVGTDITPGTYRSSGQSGCYYARLSGFGGGLGEIIANNNTDTPAIITIAASDKGFESQNCGTWTKQ